MTARTLVLCVQLGASFLLFGCGEKPYYVAGDEVTLNEATALDVIKSTPLAFEGKVVMVEGTVDAVCQGSGCWATIITTASAETLFTKSPDHEVFVPKDCSGARIRVEGVVVVMEPEPETEEEQAAHAEGEEAHFCPQPQCFVTLAAVELYRQ